MRIDAAGTPTERASLPLAESSRLGHASGGSGAAGASVFARLLRGLGAEVDQGESLARQAMGMAQDRGDAAGAELIALQAAVYRGAEALDLSARLVDRATSSIKTILQG